MDDTGKDQYRVAATHSFKLCFDILSFSKEINRSQR